MSEETVTTETPASPVPATAPDATPAGQTTEGKTFSQAELDRIIGERLKRAEETATKKLLEMAGVEKTDDLKTLVEGEKKRRESEMSATQKLEAELEKERKRAEAAETKALEVETARLEEKRNSAIKSAASDSKARYPDDAVTWLRLAENAALIDKVLDENGEPDKKALETAIAAHKKARPDYYKAQAGGVGSPSNADGQVAADTKKQLQGMKLFKL